MDNNWVVDNLQNAFITWNTKMEEMWSLLTESPETFKGGTIWNTIVTINGGMQAIGYGLLVLFFAISLFRSAASFRDFQRPEYVVRHLIQFVLAKVAITYGMDFLTKIFAVCNGIVATAAGSIGGTKEYFARRNRCRLFAAPLCGGKSPWQLALLHIPFQYRFLSQWG